jgi:hypothetical protein
LTDDLRARLQAELAAERPPPIGDVVRTAVREGRRVRRRHRIAVGGAAAAVLIVAGVAAFGPLRSLPSLPASLPPGSVPSAAAPASPSALPPGSVPSIAIGPAAASPARTVTVRDGTQRAEGMQKKATSAAMLHLLTTLLPPGRTTHYGVAVHNDLSVQLYYDAGYGPSMLRLQVARKPTEQKRAAAPKVTVGHAADDCIRDTVATAIWSDGTIVQLDVAACLDGAGGANPPAKAQLSAAEASLIVADPRWGVTMDADLVDEGARQFPGRLPVFAS